MKKNKFEKIVIIYGASDEVTEMINSDENLETIKKFNEYVKTYDDSLVVCDVTNDNILKLGIRVNGVKIILKHESEWVGNFEEMERKFGENETTKNIIFTTLYDSLNKALSFIG